MVEKLDELLGKSSFKEFNRYLSAYVNEKQGDKIYQDLFREYSVLLEAADYRGNNAIKMHMNEYILPAIAAYKSLQSNEISREIAKQYIANYLEEYMGKKAAKLRKIGKLPFFYSIFRVVLVRTMTGDYPAEGWTTKWVQKSSKEMSFNLSKCLYLEVFSINNCAELTPLFCHNDEINFGKLSSKVNFIRTKTLATGGDCCDFKFVRCM